MGTFEKIPTWPPGAIFKITAISLRFSRLFFLNLSVWSRVPDSDKRKMALFPMGGGSDHQKFSGPHPKPHCTAKVGFDPPDL